MKTLKQQIRTSSIPELCSSGSINTFGKASAEKVADKISSKSAYKSVIRILTISRDPIYLGCQSQCLKP